VYGRMSFSADGEALLAACGTAPTMIWNLTTGKSQHELAHGRSFIRAAELSSEGRWAVTGGYDGSARVWDLTSGLLRAKFTGMGGVYALSIAPDGRLLALAASKDIWIFKLWLDETSTDDARDVERMLAVLDNDDYALREQISDELVKLGFRAERMLAKAAAESISPEVRIRARLARERILSQPQRILRGHRRDILSISFSPAGERLASASDDGTVRLWDTKSLDEAAVWKASEIP
jgi:WD40 repeat protein